MSATTAATADNKLWNMLIIFIGMFLLVIHLVLHWLNNNMLFLLLSIYIIAYTVLMTVWLQKKRNCMTPREYNILSYVNMFMLIIGVLVVFLAIFSMVGGGQKSKLSPLYYR